MIKLENFSCGYQKRLVLDRINLEIPGGQIVGVVGRNGSGKSTLAQVLSGLKLDFKGKVWLDDLQLKRRTSLRQLRQKVGLVLQNPDNQILFSRVDDDIVFALENLHVPASEQPEIIHWALEQVDATELEKANPRQLSGGQKQRIVIASALAMRPEYLVLDEATSALDPIGKRSVWQVLEKLKAQGIGILFMTNWLDELTHADQILILDQQQIFSYTKAELIKHPEIFVQHGLETPPSFDQQLTRGQK